MENLAKTLILILAVYGLMGIVHAVTVPRDDTDSETERSGFSLLTDYGTGCQYLGKTWFGVGPVIPRMGPDGKQVCKKE